MGGVEIGVLQGVVGGVLAGMRTSSLVLLEWGRGGLLFLARRSRLIC